ncbi:MAG: cation:dicarboxylase symporter family transporter [Bacteroidia bacterium]|nr:cation:dicarboxylase symporter family transporter [Bacteroidia bacterium]
MEYIQLAAVAACVFWAFKKKKLTYWIFASLAAGVFIGLNFPSLGLELKIFSDIFLRLIKTIVAPLLFGTLVVGIAGHSNLKQVGRIGIKSLIYFEVVTTLALVIGLVAINLSGAGTGIDVKPGDVAELPQVKQSAKDIILHTFPENIAKAIANGEVLQVVVFSILFAMGAALVAEEKRKTMIAFCESLSEVMFKFTHLIMYAAPLAVGGAIAYTIAKNGTEVFDNLLKLLLTLYGALVAFIFLVLLPIAWLAKIPVRKFINAVTEPVSIAFATASSESALPKAMLAMEKIGVPRKIVAFVIPTGYSFNLDGTTLYLSLASVFVAQAAKVPMDWSAQLLMVFTLMLTSKGVAGVPRASLVILAGTVASFNLPSEPILIIMGIDALMDMGRTAVNVVGNCLASAVVAKWEGEWNEEVMPE